ncbi:MAG TPA: tRNA (adenosine(37)-N6)-dimethylallyltransferase MiaA [Actinobacteria bacterium]|nr:tRNA (adenosine(37)-N6)-dimethylallyltransferase MiaA [Actinomycetota bacterium]
MFNIVKKSESIKEKVLIIVGPTSVGKSEVAIELAKNLNGEIISADSMQIYKGMNIGTAKLNPREMCGVKHQLIDMIEPTENFSVAKYQRLARSSISKINKRGRLPILVGGSGLYIRAVLDKLEFPKGALKSSIRQELECRAKNNPGSLYKELEKVDCEAARTIHPNNLRRITRALEIIKLTGKSYTEYHKEWEARESIYNINIFGLNLPREKLYVNIDKRAEQMFDRDFVGEVKDLILSNKFNSVTARQALGYKEVIYYLNGMITLDETKRLIKHRTRNFAKRQITWFKRDNRIMWINVDEKKTTEVAKEIIENLNF